MAQYLILPINKARLTSSYKNENYRKQYGFNHYGVDLVSTNGDRTVYAQGKGIVKAAGYDSLFGNTVVIVYSSAMDPRTKQVLNVTVRYYHLASIRVKDEQRVTKDTVIGVYGDTGKYVDGAHLHMEFDSDTKYYNYAPGIKASGTIIKKGIDTTFNPLDMTCVKTNAPDYQTFVGSNYNTVTKGEAEACKRIKSTVA